MTGPALTLEPATPLTIDRVRSLLAANDLPTADVSVDAGQFPDAATCLGKRLD
jgi:hypothetical protein